jgi:hypothetical protein
MCRIDGCLASSTILYPYIISTLIFQGDALRAGNSLRDRIVALHEKHMFTKKRRASAD